MNSSGGFFDVAAGREALTRIENQASSPDFWNDQEAAQKLLQKRTILEKKIQRQEHFESQMADAVVLFEFAEEDEESLKELRGLVESLEHEISVAETEMLLGGENDQLNAICTIHPGAGGTESQDWAEMLLRMYLKWAEQRGFKTEVIDYQPGEEAGLKGVTFKVEGEYAYGLLSAEAGVHRLVRISPFDQAARRHTSFASLFVYPEVDENIEVELNDKDMRVDTYRATGAGGQHINTTDSASMNSNWKSGKPRPLSWKPTKQTSLSDRKSEVTYLHLINWSKTRARNWSEAMSTQCLPAT